MEQISEILSLVWRFCTLRLRRESDFLSMGSALVAWVFYIHVGLDIDFSHQLEADFASFSRQDLFTVFGLKNFAALVAAVVVAVVSTVVVVVVAAVEVT